MLLSGASLKSLRTQKHISLEQVSNTLKIRIEILKSLEEGTFEVDSPSKVASFRRFITSYAKFLNFPDISRISEMLDEDLKSVSQALPLEAPEPAREGNSIPIKTLFFVFLALCLGALLLLNSTVNRYNEERASVDYSYLTEINHVSVKIKEDTTFKVKIDQGEVLNIVAQAHQILSYTFVNNIEVVFSNAGVVSVDYNDFSLGTLAAYGERYRLALPMQKTRSPASSSSQ